jgi:tetratricopeptide (TPR) repeat protein
MLFHTRGRPALRTALLFCTAISAFAQADALAHKSQQAKQLMAQGRFADAVPIYQELCRALPANTGLRLNLALAYQMSGRHQEAIPEFERVLKADPNSQPALLSLGASHLAVNEPAKAIPFLTRFVAIQPTNVESRGMLAGALLTIGRAGDAAAHYRKLTTLSPQDPKGWHGLGRSYEALAQSAFQQLDKSAQGSPEWLALIADSRMERRQYRSAFYFYKKALEAKPDFSALHESLAEVYRRSGHEEWAEAETKKVQRPDCAASKQACDFAEGRLLPAAAGPSLYWRTRAYNELALRAFKQLGRLPASIELHAIKAEILSNHGQYMEAASEWRAAQKLAPGDLRIESRLATSLHEGGNYAEAAPLFEKLLKQEPDSAELNFFMGDSLLHMEQPEKAVPYLEAAVRRDPKLLPAHASLGLTYIRLGRDADAIPQLNSAREADEDGSIHIQLSRAYQHVGNAEAAKQMMAEYTRIRQRSESEQRNLEEKANITAP